MSRCFDRLGLGEDEAEEGEAAALPLPLLEEVSTGEWSGAGVLGNSLGDGCCWGDGGVRYFFGEVW